MKIEELPESPIRAHGPWVLVLVEPKKKLSEIIEVVSNPALDDNDEVGYAWVLSAAPYYYGPPPEQVQKNRSEKAYQLRGESSYRYEMPVRRGDYILFRRFQRSEGLVQFDMTTSNMMKISLTAFPGHEFFFLHAQYIIGVVNV